mgnify:CR=1 FL=1
MLDVAILGQVAFGYSPFIDRNRAVSATRLTVFPLKPDSAPDAAQLLHAVGGVWPADGARVSLNVASESLLQDLMQAQPAPNVMVEIPAFMAVDAANSAAIAALHRNGNTLLLNGRTYSPPYTVTAIGDVAAMRAALAAAPLVTLYKQYVVRFGLGYTEDARADVQVVGYTEPIRMRYAQPAGPIPY